ncbi:hypothetical protein BDK51DRAFT_18406, partial [Blyttiomyces helicus]
ASKRYLIHTHPQTLVLHLKRFHQTGPYGRTKKIESHVAFERVIDVAASETLYTLRGIVSHSGGLFGGHYVAYVDVGGDRWMYCSDSRVKEVAWEEVRKVQAYLLFYERGVDGEGGEA